MRKGDGDDGVCAARNERALRFSKRRAGCCHIIYNKTDSVRLYLFGRSHRVTGHCSAVLLCSSDCSVC